MQRILDVAATISGSPQYAADHNATASAADAHLAPAVPIAGVPIVCVVCGTERTDEVIGVVLCPFGIQPVVPSTIWPAFRHLRVLAAK
jgi:hypothetical protein